MVSLCITLPPKGSLREKWVPNRSRRLFPITIKPALVYMLGAKPCYIAWEVKRYSSETCLSLNAWGQTLLKGAGGYKLPEPNIFTMLGGHINPSISRWLI